MLLQQRIAEALAQRQAQNLPQGGDGFEYVEVDLVSPKPVSNVKSTQVTCMDFRSQTHKVGKQDLETSWCLVIYITKNSLKKFSCCCSISSHKFWPKIRDKAIISMKIKVSLLK